MHFSWLRNTIFFFNFDIAALGNSCLAPPPWETFGYAYELFLLIHTISSDFSPTLHVPVVLNFSRFMKNMSNPPRSPLFSISQSAKKTVYIKYSFWWIWNLCKIWPFFGLPQQQSAVRMKKTRSKKLHLCTVRQCNEAQTIKGHN